MTERRAVLLPTATNHRRPPAVRRVRLWCKRRTARGWACGRSADQNGCYTTRWSCGVVFGRDGREEYGEPAPAAGRTDALGFFPAPDASIRRHEDRRECARRHGGPGERLRTAAGRSRASLATGSASTRFTVACGSNGRSRWVRNTASVLLNGATMGPATR